MTIKAEKSMLQAKYSWKTGKGQGRQTAADRGLFSRREGPEVLAMIQDVVDHCGYQSEEDVVRIEELIATQLPQKFRGWQKVQDWLIACLEAEEASVGPTQAAWPPKSATPPAGAALGPPPGGGHVVSHPTTLPPFHGGPVAPGGPYHPEGLYHEPYGGYGQPGPPYHEPYPGQVEPGEPYHEPCGGAVAPGRPYPVPYHGGAAPGGPYPYHGGAAPGGPYPYHGGAAPGGPYHEPYGGAVAPGRPYQPDAGAVAPGGPYHEPYGHLAHHPGSIPTLMTGPESFQDFGPPPPTRPPVLGVARRVARFLNLEKEADVLAIQETIDTRLPEWITRSIFNWLVLFHELNVLQRAPDRGELPAVHQWEDTGRLSADDVVDPGNGYHVLAVMDRVIEKLGAPRIDEADPGALDMKALAGVERLIHSLPEGTQTFQEVSEWVGQEMEGEEQTTTSSLG